MVTHVVIQIIDGSSLLAPIEGIIVTARQGEDTAELSVVIGTDRFSGIITREEFDSLSAKLVSPDPQSRE